MDRQCEQTPRGTTHAEMPTGSSDSKVGKRELQKRPSPDQVAKISTLQEAVDDAAVDDAGTSDAKPQSFDQLGMVLTYKGMKESEIYIQAKEMLVQGEFEGALDLLGTLISQVVSILGQDAADEHEAMAPLFYLYGTTLLYSVEESEQMMTAAPGDQSDNEDSDLMIASENLEAARVIINKLLESREDVLLQLDLAQVHQRLGDMLRSEMDLLGEAMKHYQSCLDIRCQILDLFDKRVAELHLKIGQVYELLASHPEKSQEGSVKQSKEDLQKEAQVHFLACAKSFAGNIALVCGSNPDEMIADAKPTGKSTGLSVVELQISTMSATMKAIRDRTAALKLPPNLSDQSKVAEWKEILDSIQESIDNSVRTLDATAEVVEMKVQAKATAESGGIVNNADGSTTSIGFDLPTNSILSGSNGSAPVAVNLVPVRKKRKANSTDQSMKK